MMYIKAVIGTNCLSTPLTWQTQTLLSCQGSDETLRGQPLELPEAKVHRKPLRQCWIRYCRATRRHCSVLKAVSKQESVSEGGDLILADLDQLSLMQQRLTWGWRSQAIVFEQSKKYDIKPEKQPVLESRLKVSSLPVLQHIGLQVVWRWLVAVADCRPGQGEPRRALQYLLTGCWLWKAVNCPQ